MAKNQRLNQKQVDVLRWVYDGCPDGVYPDGFYHRITAAALHSDGLIEVRKRPWAATITVDGLYYLEQGSYPQVPQPIKPPRTVPLPAPALQPVPVGDVMAIVAIAAVGDDSYLCVLNEERERRDAGHRHFMEGADSMRPNHVGIADGIVAPPVVVLAGELENPARHRPGNPRVGELSNEPA